MMAGEFACKVPRESSKFMSQGGKSPLEKKTLWGPSLIIKDSPHESRGNT